MKALFKVPFIILGIVIVSLYFFPFIFKPIPIVNTKQFMAVIGLIILGIRLSEGKGLGFGFIEYDFSMLSGLALLVSLAGFISITYNNTPDTSYSTYFMSFWVWMGGAYGVCAYIRYLHGNLSIPLISNYLIAVCVIQCILALWFNLDVPVRDFIDRYVEQDQDFLNANRVERLYGIGASLDTAGTRFSVVLIIIAFLSFRLENTTLRKTLPLYLMSFLIIAIIGNIVSRTTIVGVIIALGYFLFASWDRGMQISKKAKRVWTWTSIALLIAIPISVYFYNTDPTIHKHFRFAFEGFFSLAEKGVWEVSSNEKLKTMYVFPETLKTWTIGDGYFSNPRDTDPFFTGEIIGGYYMGTDVGYLRFIFYFGLLGLVAFITFLGNVCKTCIARHKSFTFLFLMILFSNFIIWFKVATDIFLVFALFLCITQEENNQFMESIETNNQECELPIV